MLLRHYFWILLVLLIIFLPFAALGMMTLGHLGLGVPIFAVLAALFVVVSIIGVLRDRRSTGPRPPRPGVTIKSEPATVLAAPVKELRAA